MQFLAAYVLKGRAQAVMVTAVMAVLALSLPPLSYLSGATVALITLRYGLRAGLQLCLLATAVSVLLMLPLQRPPQLGGAFLLVLWLPVWVLAVSLRRTASPARSIALATLFGLMLLLGLYLAIDNPSEWWLGVLQKMLAPMLEQMPAGELPQAKAALAELAAQMSGVMSAGLVASLIGCLLLGRWWQSLLFNPGGFGDEFRRLKLGQVAALLALLLAVVLLLAQLAESGATGVLRDLLALVQVAFALQGIAVVHALARRYRASIGVMVVFYVLLIMGPLALLVAVIGVLDNWFDFRSRFGQGKRTDVE